MVTTEKLKKFYENNHFVEACNMGFDRAEDGEAILHIDVLTQHTNLYHFAHGGVLATLVDTAMGVAAASLGSRIVTMNLNLSFIHSVSVGERAIARAKIVHAGHSTMVANCEVRNENQELIATGTGTLFIVGRMED